jgi:hypothetical protein
MKEAESQLPAGILSRAILSGREYGWRREDILEAIAAAPSAGLAVLGGQVQFVMPGTTCELYWMNYDPEERKENEIWAEYTERTAKETIKALRPVMKEDLVQIAVDHFEVLKNAKANGVCLDDYLLFILCFQSEDDV